MSSFLALCGWRRPPQDHPETELFLYGSVLYLYRDRIPVSTAAAALCLVTVLAGGFTMKNAGMVAGPPLAYLCIWLGPRLPFQRVGRRHDLSYGIYVFAFPLQQLLAVYGVHRHGLVAYYASFLALAPLAGAASWFLVERRALALKNWTPRWLERRAARRATRPAMIPVQGQPVQGQSSAASSAPTGT